MVMMKVFKLENTKSAKASVLSSIISVRISHSCVAFDIGKF